MGMKEGSVILINLQCGCTEKRITVLHGNQEIKCPECGKRTDVEIRINSNDEVENLRVY